MSIRGADPIGPVSESRRPGVVPHGLFGMLVFVLTEIMLFAGLISAFFIGRAASPDWPPAGQPRLPIEATAFNTLVLLGSGALLILAHRYFHQGDRASMRRPFMLSLGLGVFFVLFQGVEWVRLIGQGLTLTSSNLGSFFYLVVGMHAFHATCALLLLGYANLRLHRGYLTASLFGAAEVLWLFVVAVWPILYWVVYL